MSAGLRDLLGNGRVADLLLVVTALEGAALVVFHRWTGRGIPSAEILSNLLSGAFLVLALRCALTGMPWPWLALCLLLALLAHLADLRVRIRICSGRRASAD